MAAFIRKTKLQIVSAKNGIQGIAWERIIPDEDNDWINLRNPNFISFMPMADKKRETNCFFSSYAIGLCTSRDAWSYDFTYVKVLGKMHAFVDFYNTETTRCHKLLSETGLTEKKTIEKFMAENRDNNSRMISWSRGLNRYFERGDTINDDAPVRTVMYRPFQKRKLYYEKSTIEYPSSFQYSRKGV